MDSLVPDFAVLPTAFLVESALAPTTVSSSFIRSHPGDHAQEKLTLIDLIPGSGALIFGVGRRGTGSDNRVAGDLSVTWLWNWDHVGAR